MTRVAVIGNAGGGKSTLCRQLSRARGLPHYAIDRIQWLPGWQPAPPNEFAAAHDEMVGHERWIIDGFGPWEAIEQRFARADTIVLVDHPLWLHFWWAAKRQIKALFIGRVDGPEGCPMVPVTFRLFRMIWQIHRATRPRLLALVDKYRCGRQVFHIHSPRELAAFRARFACAQMQPRATA